MRRGGIAAQFNDYSSVAKLIDNWTQNRGWRVKLSSKTLDTARRRMGGQAAFRSPTYGQQHCGPHERGRAVIEREARLDSLRRGRQFSADQHDSPRDIHPSQQIRHGRQCAINRLVTARADLKPDVRPLADLK